MQKIILRKSILCLVYLSSVYPWAAQLLAPFIGWNRVYLLGICWLVIGCIAQIFPFIGKKDVAWIRIAMSIVALGSSFIMGGLFAASSGSIAIVIIVVLTTMMWIIALVISRLDFISGYMKGRSLFLCLLILSIHAVVFPAAAVLSYVSFLVCVSSSSALLLKWDSDHRSISGVITIFVFIVALLFGSLRDVIVMAAWLFYRYIIVNVILAMLFPLGYISRGLMDPFNVGKEAQPKAEDTLPESQDLTKSDVKPDTAAYHFLQTLMPYIKIALLIVLVLAMAYIIYRIIRKYSLKKTSKVSDWERKESIQPDKTISQMLMEKVRNLLHPNKGNPLGFSPEGKIRKMYRDILIRMRKKNLSINHTTTPLEAMELLPKPEELFPLYNDVRYGEKKITSDQLNRAEQSFHETKDILK